MGMDVNVGLQAGRMGLQAGHVGLQAGHVGLQAGRVGLQAGRLGLRRLGGADHDGDHLGEGFGDGAGRANRALPPVRADSGEVQGLDTVGGGVARHLKQ
jgi:hypothetical protein